MVDQDPPLIIDHKELEPACQHSLAAGEQHLPAERHDIAALSGAGGGPKANAVAPATFIPVA